MYDNYESISVTIEDRIATISFLTMALSTASYKEIRDCLELMSDDDNIGAIVVTGALKHFSAGGDIKSFKKRIDNKTYLPAENIVDTTPFAASPKYCSKPVIAMVNGVAAGAGCGFALGCDFRVMSPSSKLICAFINMALPGDSCCAYFLEKMVGTGKATELMMTGKPVKGEEAARLGMAICAEDDSKLKETTYALANKLAHGPSQAYKWQKKLFLDVYYRELGSNSFHEAVGMAACAKTDDFAEAVNAFIEKRNPTFTGK